MSKLLAGISQAQKTAAELEASQRAAAESINELRAEILAGETTGNQIKDYLIVNFGLIHEHDRARYEGINRLLKGKTGELIIVERRVSVCVCHRFVGPSDYEETDYFVTLPFFRAMSLSFPSATAR